jgi:hypothetical protein
MGLRKGRVSLVEWIWVALFLPLLVGTVWGLLTSAARTDWNWFFGILLAWFVGLGGIVGWVYVWRTRRQAQGSSV